jgi:hypothetical protein
VPDPRIRSAIVESTAGRPARDFVPVGDRLFLVVSEPAMFADEVLGTMTVGYAIDDAVAGRLAQETHCDVTIGAGGSLYASSLPKAERAALADLTAAAGGDRLAAGVSPRVTRIGAGDYVVGMFPLPESGEDGGGRLVLLQNWAPTAQFIDEIHPFARGRRRHSGGRACGGSRVQPPHEPAAARAR